MDIVYIVKQNGDNDELRYSLRSLDNIKYDRVFIVGHKPYWCQNVIHIPFEDKKHKYKNVKAKHKIIANLDLEDFVYMNDDFYFLKPQEVKNYHIGTIGEQLKYIIRRDGNKESYYQNGLEYIKELFGENAMSFEAHTPMIMNGKKLKSLIEKYPDYPTTILRTLYGNEYGLKSDWLIAPNYKGYIEKCIDCKCYTLDTLELIEGQLLLSSENTIGGTKEFDDFMNNIFSICKYEKVREYPSKQFRYEHFKHLMDYNGTEEACLYRDYCNKFAKSKI